MILFTLQKPLGHNVHRMDLLVYTMAGLKYFLALTSLGFRGLFINYYAALCAAFSALGGMLFGYEYDSSL